MGELGVNSFSIISYMASFTMSVLFGSSEGLQPLFGQSYGAKDKDSLKYCFRAGCVISLAGSAAIVGLTILLDRGTCALFGADAETLAFTVQSMPQYVWGFVIAGMNILVSAYFYSTKRSNQAIILNVMRSLVVNIVVILGLPALLGREIVWYTFGIYECIVLVLALALLKHSERNGLYNQES